MATKDHLTQDDIGITVQPFDPSSGGTNQEQTWVEEQTFTEITILNSLKGPASMVIDPDTHGDDTGTVIIAGDLQVNGTTTTVNSTEVSITDTTFTLASEAAALTELQGAGVIWGNGMINFLYDDNVSAMVLDTDLFINGSKALVNNDIGIRLQQYDPNIVSDVNYVHTEENFSTALLSKLSFIEPDATADQEPQEILNALITVDGVGSGLDADLLDGYDTDVLATGDTIALRDPEGDLSVNTLNVGKGPNGGILFEDGKHQITNNDGGSNFSIRVGHTQADGITEDGYANALIFAQSAGYLRLQSSNASMLTGATPTMINQALFTPNAQYLFYQDDQKFQTTSGGVIIEGNIVVSGKVDGRDLAIDGAKLDLIEDEATADQTATEILDLIKTVHGDTSGLDADLLDGLEATAFVLNSDIGTTVEPYDATILKDADIGVNVEPYDATILKDADIGVNIQAYDPNIVSDVNYVQTENNFSNTLKTKLENTDVTATQGWNIIISNTTVEINKKYMLVATGNLNVTLPLLPNPGDSVQISDGASVAETHALIILRNGNNIESSASDYVIAGNGDTLEFVYINATIGWKIINIDSGSVQDFENAL